MGGTNLELVKDLILLRQKETFIEALTYLRKQVTNDDSRVLSGD